MALTAGYQRQSFPRSEAGNLSQSDHKATYELPPGVYDGSDTYIGFQARLDSKPWTGSAHLADYPASPSGAVYQTQLVINRPDLNTVANRNNYSKEELIPFDPSQFMQYADVRFDKIGNVHHVNLVSMWKRALDEISKSVTQKRAESAVRGTSYGFDRNNVFNSGFQDIFTDRPATNKEVELRADINEILPILGQPIDTRGAGQTFVETYMNLDAARAVSALYPRPPFFLHSDMELWGGFTSHHTRGIAADHAHSTALVVPANRRRPRFIFKNTEFSSEHRKHLATGNYMFVSGQSGGDSSKLVYRFGKITGQPTYPWSPATHIMVELLDMQANLPDSRSKHHEAMDVWNFDFFSAHSTSSSPEFLKHMCVMDNFGVIGLDENISLPTSIGNKITIPGCYTHASETGYYVSQHVLVAAEMVMLASDESVLSPIGSSEYAQALDYSNVRLEAKPTHSGNPIIQLNTTISAMSVNSDGTVELTLADSFTVSHVPEHYGNALADVAYPIAMMVFPINGADPTLEIGNTNLKVKRLPSNANIPTMIAVRDFAVSRQTLSTSDITNYTFKTDPTTDLVLVMFPKPNSSHPTMSVFPELTKYRIFVDNAQQTPFDVDLDPRKITTHLRYLDQFFKARGVPVGDLSFVYKNITDTVKSRAESWKNQTEDLERIVVLPVLIAPGVEHTLQMQLHIDSSYTKDTFEIAVLERKQKAIDLDPMKMFS